jgi:intein/homing endonuclease
MLADVWAFADDFEVSIFLTETATRHSLLTKSKTFKDNDEITHNANRLIGTDKEPVLIRGESDDEADLIPFDKIPSANDSADDDEPSKKRVRNSARRQGPERDVDEDDKKKLTFKTSYEGFSIWGWVLCLLVDRKGGPGKKASGPDAQALMAEWITSTQLQQEDDG